MVITGMREAAGGRQPAAAQPPLNHVHVKEPTVLPLLTLTSLDLVYIPHEHTAANQAGNHEPQHHCCIDNYSATIM